MRHRAVFLDRDGTLNEPVVRDGLPKPATVVEDVVFSHGAREAVALLKQSNFVTICVTNQPDVARGTLSLADAQSINRYVATQLSLDDLRACFHDDGDGCDCRKPLPGMLFRGAASWDVDPCRSYMVGDRWRDIEAGAAAGCRTVLIDRQWPERAARVEPDARVASLSDAVRWIVDDPWSFE